MENTISDSGIHFKSNLFFRYGFLVITLVLLIYLIYAYLNNEIRSSQVTLIVGSVFSIFFFFNSKVSIFKDQVHIIKNFWLIPFLNKKIIFSNIINVSSSFEIHSTGGYPQVTVRYKNGKENKINLYIIDIFNLKSFERELKLAVIGGKYEDIHFNFINSFFIKCFIFSGRTT
jgi:hypothetical protein